jgi:putative FmdB family regulatory protein
LPRYDYVCSNCGHRMEVSHSIHGPGPADCPKCGGPVKKAFSAPAVHFKGTGWARKERSGGARTADLKASAAESAAASQSPSSTEPSPAPSAKPDTTAS